MADLSDDGLKPCPFCGSGAMFTIEQRDSHPDFGGHSAACGSCGAGVGYLFACGDDPRPRLAEMWNKRVADRALNPQAAEPDMRHPKIQALIGSNARRNIELSLVEQLIDNPDCDLSSTDMEYWYGLHDKLRDALKRATPQAQPAPVGADGLPELPQWSKMDDLGGLVPSQIRQELRAYALAALVARRDKSHDPK